MGMSVPFFRLERIYPPEMYQNSVELLYFQIHGDTI